MLLNRFDFKFDALPALLYRGNFLSLSSSLRKDPWGPVELRQVPPPDQDSCPHQVCLCQVTLCISLSLTLALVLFTPILFLILKWNQKDVRIRYLLNCCNKYKTMYLFDICFDRCHVLYINKHPEDGTIGIRLVA